jgi:hypothetical protein
VFSTGDIIGYPGNSGGPLCVQCTNGIYYPAAVYLGGTENAFVRSIDGDVADLINRANVTAYTGAIHVGGGVIPVSTCQGCSQFVPATYQMQLGPAAALAEGAGRLISQLTNKTYFTDTSQTYSLPAGTYTITFRPIPGYLTPANLILQLTAGEKAIVTDTYVAVAGGAAKFTSESLSGGLLQMALSAGAGQNYALERSINLVNWTPLTTNTVAAGGTVTFTDTPATNNSKAVFYRARLAP